MLNKTAQVDFRLFKKFLAKKLRVQKTLLEGESSNAPTFGIDRFTKASADGRPIPIIDRLVLL
jgi:hypothetical protein